MQVATMEKVMEDYKRDEIFYLESLEQMEVFTSKIRFRMIGKLAETPKTAAQLARDLEISRPKAHYHLQVMVKLGFAILLYEKLVNGIMEKYYIGRAHFYSFDNLDLYANEHPQDTVFIKKLAQAKNDYLHNVLDMAREGPLNPEHSRPTGNDFLFNFGCHLSDEQISDIQERLSVVSEIVRDFHAQNMKRPDYRELPFYKNILLLLPLKSQNVLASDDIIQRSS